jgi:hypothetical protein
VFENRVLRRIFTPKREDVTAAGSTGHVTLMREVRRVHKIVILFVNISE